MAGLGVVGARQVSRTADHFRDQAGQHFEGLAAPLAGGLLGAALGDGLLVLVDRLGDVLRQAARHGGVELALLGRRGEALLPGLVVFLRALPGFRPGLLDRGRHFEGRVFPADVFADACDFLSAVRAAMGLARAGDFGAP